MRHSIKLFTLPLIVFLSACSYKQGEVFTKADVPQSTNKANVVVYRIKQFSGGGVLTPVYINGKKQNFMLSGGSFHTLELPAGKYIFHTEPANWMTPIARKTEVRFEAGSEYYMRFSTDNYMVVMFDHFELISKEDAMKELKIIRESLEQ